MNKTPHSYHKIRFTDCDPFGHLNNARYLDYLIDAREDHLHQEYDFKVNEWYHKGIAWVIANHEIAYLKPAQYNEIVCIESTLIEVNEHYLRLETRMLNKDKTQLKALMRSRMVPIGIRDGKKQAHTPELMEWAQALVNQDAQADIIFEQRVTEYAKLLKV